MKHYGTNKRLSYNEFRHKIPLERRDLMHQPRRALDRDEVQQIVIPSKQDLARPTFQPARCPYRPRESIKIRNLMPLWIRNASHLQRDSRKVGSDGTSRQFLRFGPASRTPRQSASCRHSVDYKSSVRARNQLRPHFRRNEPPFPATLWVVCVYYGKMWVRGRFVCGPQSPRLYHPDKQKVGTSWNVSRCRNKIRIGRRFQVCNRLSDMPGKPALLLCWPRKRPLVIQG